MRSIDLSLKERLQLKAMTAANNANPSMEITAIRPQTPIFNSRFWQESVVSAGVTAVCTSVAVRRTGRLADRVYVAYVDSTGLLTVKYAALAYPVSSMTWHTVTTIAGCSACALEFDGTFIKAAYGKVEFRTSELPWLFYITAAGALMGGILGSEYTTLAETGVTAVTAVRGYAKPLWDIDAGLLVFFVVDGDIYYRSRVAEVWSDGAPIAFGPDVTWVYINAINTFDYRIVIQATDSTGALYELFSEPEGIGKKSIDNLEIVDVSATGELVDIIFWDATGNENIEITDISAAAALIYGLSPIPLAIQNIDNGTGDWGKYLTVRFDYPVYGLIGNAGQIVITDGNLAEYAGQTIEYVGTDFKTVKIGYTNFNGAYGTTCELKYTQGTMTGPAGELVSDFTFEFVPSNLSVPEPAVALSAYNIDNNQIVVVFDKTLDSASIAGNQTALTISGYEYTYFPGGALIAKAYTASATAEVSEDQTKMLITLLGSARMKAPIGNVAVAYAQASGLLTSFGALVQSFSLSFAPENITPVYNINDLENIEIANVSGTGTLSLITYRNAQVGPEKIEIASVSAAGTLTHIDDL